MNAVKMGMTIEEAAECTGIGRNTMRKLVDWGKLPVLKVGRKTIIRKDTLERFMTVNRAETCSVRTKFARWNNCSLSPRRLRAKYTPRTNLAICTQGISPLRGATVSTLAGNPCRF